VGAPKIERLLALAERVRVSLSLDDLAVAEPIGRAAHARGTAVDVLLEINTGLDRMGVLPAAAPGIARAIAEFPGLRLRGVMTHEGQALPRSPNEETLAAETAAAARTMADVAESIRESGIACEVVSMGTTATARFDARAPGVTEIRPGTYVFSDLTMTSHGATRLQETAVWAIATVVSRPSSDRAIVDAGSKVLSSDRMPRRPSGPPGGTCVGGARHHRDATRVPAADRGQGRHRAQPHLHDHQPRGLRPGRKGRRHRGRVARRRERTCPLMSDAPRRHDGRHVTGP
jgi:D-serine deaminase-like pyridoxal phosphate-dependent protein